MSREHRMLRTAAALVIGLAASAAVPRSASADVAWEDGQPVFRPSRQRAPSYQAPAASPYSLGFQLEPMRPRYRSPELASGGPQPEIAAVAPTTIQRETGEAPGTVLIDSAARKLLYVIDETSVYQYPIAVGREGFSWTGVEQISRVQEWPDWFPPPEMRDRDPQLPIKMTGGLKNPLGAKALYLGNTLYRIHGTNDPTSIGSASSSGCFRMRNEHVAHLASVVSIGATVKVLSALAPPLPTPNPVRQDLAARSPSQWMAAAAVVPKPARAQAVAAPRPRLIRAGARGGDLDIVAPRPQRVR